MATYLLERFDTTANGGVPTTMTAANMAVENTVGLSGANGIGVSVAASPGRVFTTVTDAAGGDMRVRMAFRMEANLSRIGVFLRHNGGSSSSFSAYSASIALGGSAGNAGIAVHSWASGAATTLGVEDLFASSFALSTWYAFDVTIVGSVISVGVQRQSDSAWLQSSGAWASTLARPISRTDTSITGVSHAGIIGFGALATVYGDDFYFTDAADTTGFFTSSSSFTNVLPNATGIFWPKGAVAFNSSNGAIVIDNGTYCKLNFTGTSLALRVNVAGFKGGGISPSLWGSFYCVIDFQTTRKVVLVDPGSGINSYDAVVATGLSSGAHTCLIMRGIIDETNEWTGVDEVILESFRVDSGATCSAPTSFFAPRPKTGLFVGDSKFLGYSTDDSPFGTDYAPGTMVNIMMSAIHCEGAQVGKSGQGWRKAGTGGETGGLDFPATWNLLKSGISRDVSGLDYLVVGHGTNDTLDVTSTVSSWLITARAAVGASCNIVLITPDRANASTSQIKAGAAAYLAAHTSDLKVFVIDPATLIPFPASGASSGADFMGVDGVHNNSIGQAHLGAALGAEIVRLTTAGGSSSGGGVLDLTQPLGTGIWASTTVGDALKSAWAYAHSNFALNVGLKKLTYFAPDNSTPLEAFNIDNLSAPLTRTK